MIGQGMLRAPIQRAGVVQDLVERDAGEIGELHLDDRPHSFHRRADRRADHGVFADRRVQDASGKLFRQTFRGFERAAEFSADVLSVNEDALVLAQKMRLRFADRFEVGDAHRKFDRLSSRRRDARTNLLRCPTGALRAALSDGSLRLRPRSSCAPFACKRLRGPAEFLFEDQLLGAL